MDIYCLLVYLFIVFNIDRILFKNNPKNKKNKNLKKLIKVKL